MQLALLLLPFASPACLRAADPVIEPAMWSWLTSIWPGLCPGNLQPFREFTANSGLVLYRSVFISSWFCICIHLFPIPLCISLSSKYIFFSVAVFSDF